MSKEKHTPEPWGVRVTSVGTNIFSEKQSTYLMYMSQTRTVKEGNANAYRVVECVNAMEGIENPAEFMATVRKLVEEVHNGSRSEAWDIAQDLSNQFANK
jgi:hypothetical protein